MLLEQFHIDIFHTSMTFNKTSLAASSPVWTCLLIDYCSLLSEQTLPQQRQNKYRQGLKVGYESCLSFSPPEFRVIFCLSIARRNHSSDCR